MISSIAHTSSSQSYLKRSVVGHNKIKLKAVKAIDPMTNSVALGITRGEALTIVDCEGAENYDPINRHLETQKKNSYT